MDCRWFYSQLIHSKTGRPEQYFLYKIEHFPVTWGHFWSFGAIFGVGVRFKNIFGTYLCSQSTLVLEVQPYLFAFTSAKFWAFLPFLDLWGLFLGLRSGSKTFLGPTYVDSQLWFLKYSPIFLFLIRPDLGLFPLFRPFGPIKNKKIWLYFQSQSWLSTQVGSHSFFESDPSPKNSPERLKKAPNFTKLKMKGPKNSPKVKKGPKCGQIENKKIWLYFQNQS